MAELIAYRTDHDGHKFELYYQEEDVSLVNISTGVVSEGELVAQPDREPVLTLKFKPGTTPLWREVLWLLQDFP